MSHSGRYERERDVAVAAAQDAAGLIRRHAGRIRQDEVRDKGTHDLVTDFDEQVQREIVERLEAAFPDYAMLAEEGDEDDASPTAEGLRWIIDPIDGTTNFTRGVPPYAVSIGLQHEGAMVVGVVLDVAHGELFTAIRGGGLYVNGARTEVSRTPTLEESLLTTGFPYRAFDHIDAYLQAMRTLMQRTHGLRRPGSASVDLAWVAAGRFDGFFETGLKPWDVAAGMLLVEEGGGAVSDYAGRPDPLFAEHFLATNGRIHEEMVAVLHEAFGED